MKLLIVDDSGMARVFIKKEVESIPDIEIIEAKNGKDAIDKVTEHLPDLVTMDLDMPQMDGIIATTEIRQRSQYVNIPIVIITSSTTEELRKRAFDAGAVEFFSKPFPPGKLRQYIEDMLSKDEQTEGFNILVVDDSATIRTIVTRILAAKGANVIQAKDGLEAVDILAKTPVDMIVTDYMMPRMDGIKLCQHVRQEIKREDIPIIILTAAGEREIALNALDSGANDFISKPFSREEFLARITNHLRLIKFYRQIQEANKLLAEQNMEMEEDLITAEVVQKRLFISYKVPQFLKIATRYLPYSHVSGDIYRLWSSTDKDYNLFLGDGTGHGVAAALTTVMAKMGLDEKLDEPSLINIMNHLNNIFDEHLDDDRFLSAIYVRVNSNGVLNITSAGHPPLIIIPANGTDPVLLKPDGTLLGLFPSEMVSYTEENYSLKHGDRGFLYTDGITERMNPENEIFGEERLGAFLQKNKSRDLEQLLSSLLDELEEFSQGVPPYDDVTIVAFEYVDK